MSVQEPLLSVVEPKRIVNQEHPEALALFEHAFAGYSGYEHFQALLEEGWGWRKAAYIAWSSLPKSERWPERIDNSDPDEPGLAQILGLTSASAIYKWRRNKAIMAAIASASVGRLVAHVADVDEALLNSAKNEDYKHNPDRQLFYARTGIYVPKSKVGISLGEDDANDFEQMSTEELLKLVGEDIDADELLALEAGDGSDDSSE